MYQQLSNYLEEMAYQFLSLHENKAILKPFEWSILYWGEYTGMLSFISIYGFIFQLDSLEIITYDQCIQYTKHDLYTYDLMES